MSWQPTREPERADAASDDAVDLVLSGRPRDIGAFSVRRVLPSPQRRLVGPFIFFDHFGPVDLPPGDGMNVRPHPHIALATVTYLFDGEIFHRDSLGSALAIRPGAVNLMVAGRGIVHSERSTPETRAAGQHMHGIQLWLALPKAHEEDPPSFRHYPAKDIPDATLPGARLRVVIGSAYGVTSPVEVPMPTLYVEARLEAGAELALPDDVIERAAYVVEGAVRVHRQELEVGDMAVLARGARAVVRAERASRVMLLGGAPLDGERHIFWNFVSSDPERIEQAKRDWKELRFPLVPGDEEERIPLPE